MGARLRVVRGDRIPPESGGGGSSELPGHFLATGLISNSIRLHQKLKGTQLKLVM